VSAPTFEVGGSSAEIDRLVREKLSAGEPLYRIDRARLTELAPDLVITQTHCDVCAVGPGAVAEAHTWPGLEGLRTVSMRGGSLDGILQDFSTVAAAMGVEEAGRTLVASLDETRTRWQRATAPLPRPRVLCLEWTEPPFPMGNWGPELVELAGGTPVLGNANAHSSAVSWEAVRQADPDVLVVAPCGFDLRRALSEAQALGDRPGWSDLRAVRAGRVFVSDGDRYFNRSGPTVFDTIAVLAEMLHPTVFAPRHQDTVYQRGLTA